MWTKCFLREPREDSALGQRWAPELTHCERTGIVNWSEVRTGWAYMGTLHTVGEVEHKHSTGWAALLCCEHMPRAMVVWPLAIYIQAVVGLRNILAARCG